MRDKREDLCNSEEMLTRRGEGGRSIRIAISTVNIRAFGRRGRRGGRRVRKMERGTGILP